MTEQRKKFLLDLFHNRAPIAKTFGMKLEFDDEGHARIYMPYNPDYDNAGNTVHGGIITALLDNAGVLTCAYSRPGPEKGIMVTSELSIHMFRPAVKTDLFAQGNIIKQGKLQDVAEMSCFDQDNNLIAHGVGTFLHIGK